jgi:hypothetical protein
VTSLSLQLGDAYILNLFEMTSTAQANMTSHEAINFLPASYGARTMRGLTITTGDPTQTHIIFSGNIDGSTPNGTGIVIDYHVTKGGSADKHFIVDLQPNQKYLVTETVVSGAVTAYRLTPTNNVVLGANSQGVMEFTPADLANQTQTIPPLTIDDVNPSAGSDETVVYGTPVVVIDIDDFPPDKPSPPPGAPTPAIGSDDGTSTFQTIPVGVTSQAIDINDFNPGIGSEDTVGIGTNQNITIDDTVGVDDSESTFQVVSIYTPGAQYQEKIIRPASPFLYPNSDLGSNYCDPTPGDGILWNKLTAGDDSTYIQFRATSNVPPVTFMPNAYAQFGLDDPTGFARNIRSFRFCVRFAILLTDAVQPLLVTKLYKQNSGTQDFQYNFVLDNTAPVGVEYHSPAITADLSADVLKTCTIKIEPRALVSYGTSWTIRPSALWIEILSYDGPEKVI